MASGQSNHDYLDFILNLIRQKGLSLYVRDFSFLGFPSHYVFIEEMSSPHPLTGEECRFFYHDLEEAFNVIFRIDEAGSSEIASLARIFSDKIRSETIFSSRLYLHLPFTGMPVLEWVDPLVFVVFIFIESGRLDEAQKLLEASKHDIVSAAIASVKSMLSTYCRLAKRKDLSPCGPDKIRGYSL